MKRLTTLALILAIGISVTGCRGMRSLRTPASRNGTPRVQDNTAARQALAQAERLFEQLDYEGVIRTLQPHQANTLPLKEGTRLRHLLGAAHYYTGNKQAAARVFAACPPTLNPVEFPPSLLTFYQEHAGQSPQP